MYSTFYISLYLYVYTFSRGDVAWKKNILSKRINSNANALCFLRLLGTTNKNEDINQELIANVRQLIGPIASFRIVGSVNALPKTRSGKIMRKAIAKLANSEQVKVLKQYHIFCDIFAVNIRLSLK